MQIKLLALLCAGLAVAGCETTSGGDTGYLTHSTYDLNASERAAVQAGMNAYLKIPLTLSGLSSSYRHEGGAIAVCGYVSGHVGNKTAPPAIFAGHLIGGRFTPIRVPGRGQDPNRIAAVRAFCQAEQVSI